MDSFKTIYQFFRHAEKISILRIRMSDFHLFYSSLIESLLFFHLVVLEFLLGLKRIG